MLPGAFAASALPFPPSSTLSSPAAATASMPSSLPLKPLLAIGMLSLCLFA
ncbi:hypothetical protein E2C01_085585 [Portunus trituberculatus]|uniref:Uncharacterized protein n=1 Tax=Portunus trituberculatus TaxID=210409 RepID=A0A5B7J1E3_PORTR|nr:hypothetical protein [Portunus trituberculatus]